jgi:hypothetical protein
MTTTNARTVFTGSLLSTISSWAARATVRPRGPWDVRHGGDLAHQAPDADPDG